MAGVKRPSFLKKQKEQKRLARAAAKREDRKARKAAKAARLESPEEFGPEPDLPIEDSGPSESEAESQP